MPRPAIRPIRPIRIHHACDEDENPDEQVDSVENGVEPDRALGAHG